MPLLQQPPGLALHPLCGVFSLHMRHAQACKQCFDRFVHLGIFSGRGFCWRLISRLDHSYTLSVGCVLATLEKFVENLDDLRPVAIVEALLNLSEDERRAAHCIVATSQHA